MSAKRKLFLMIGSLVAVICLTTVVSSSDDTDGSMTHAGIDKLISSRVELINDILHSPDAANMENLGRIVNPHDESELMFYMNSIADGTIKAYEEGSASMGKLIAHSRKTTEGEPSALLGYLRLSLMAYNIRPGNEPPSFVYKSFKILGSNDYSVTCDFKINNASGHVEKKNAELIFEKGDTPQKDLFLQKISISGHIVYGWWH